MPEEDGAGDALGAGADDALGASSSITMGILRTRLRRSEAWLETRLDTREPGVPRSTTRRGLA